MSPGPFHLEHHCGRCGTPYPLTRELLDGGWERASRCPACQPAPSAEQTVQPDMTWFGGLIERRAGDEPPRTRFPRFRRKDKT